MQVKRECILTILAPSLIFLSGFLNHILYHDYGVFKYEVILGMVFIGMVGTVAGFLLAAAGPTRLRAFGFAILLFVFFDIQFDLINTIYEQYTSDSGLLQKYGIPIVSLFVFQLIILGLHKHIATIITIIFAVTILTTIALPIQKVSYGAPKAAALKTAGADWSPIIHLVLDGHIGIEGIPRDIEGGTELRDLLVEFYQRWGFRLYGRAYSKYLMTYDSITKLLNGEESPFDASLVKVTKQHGKTTWMPAQNDYFRKFSDAGYLIHVYQSEYLDYCQGFKNEIEYCYKYANSSPQLVRELDIPVTEKTELILGSYFGDTAIFHIMQNLYNRIYELYPNDLIPAWERKNFEFSSLGVPAVISHLQRDIASNPKGRLFFAHLLLPHGPYLWDSNCQVRSDSDTWLSRRMDHEDLTTFSNPQYRETAYKYYFQQAVCTVSLLDDLFESFANTGLLEEATIIIHSDHGSRITLADPVAPMSDHAKIRDYIDGFSTLFAIRSNMTAPGYDDQSRSIQNLFSELVLDRPAVADDGTVFLHAVPIVRSSPMEAVPMPEL